MAEELADALLGVTVFSDARNGLFLAAPRRTGKSTFLQNDLRPELQMRGVSVVYVDLWSDLRRDPAELLVAAVAQALQERRGLMAKASSALGVKSVNLGGWLTLDADKGGQIAGSTLSQALMALSKLTKAPVALMVDEAQHALSSIAGEEAMAALKSARDQMNSPDHADLLLIMSGSDRDKLLRLVNGHAAPFFGSQVHEMPLLNEDFVHHVAGLITAQRPDLHPVDEQALFAAFQHFGHRPQFFLEGLGLALSPVAGHDLRFEQVLLDRALAQQKAEQSARGLAFLGLKPLEQAVLWRMMEQDIQYRPYDSESMQFYRDKTQIKVSVAKVQNALERLRLMSPAMVWQSSRGEYLLADAALTRWYQVQVQAGLWPPQVTNNH